MAPKRRGGDVHLGTLNKPDRGGVFWVCQLYHGRAKP